MSNDIDTNALAEAFPPIDPGLKPLGARILVQFKQTPKKVTSSGIVLVEETKETEKWNTQVAKIIAVGPLAFKKRESMEPWPEGSWASVGDYVRVPKWGGDRIEVPFTDKQGMDEVALFATFNDHELISAITGDPLKVRAFI
jgi:co-chaperonin GroES (HSP10)